MTFGLKAPRSPFFNFEILFVSFMLGGMEKKNGATAATANTSFFDVVFLCKVPFPVWRLLILSFVQLSGIQLQHVLRRYLILVTLSRGTPSFEKMHHYHAHAIIQSWKLNLTE